MLALVLPGWQFGALARAASPEMLCQDPACDCAAANPSNAAGCCCGLNGGTLPLEEGEKLPPDSGNSNGKGSGKQGASVGSVVAWSHGLLASWIGSVKQHQAAFQVLRAQARLLPLPAQARHQVFCRLVI